MSNVIAKKKKSLFLKIISFIWHPQPVYSADYFSTVDNINETHIDQEYLAFIEARRAELLAIAHYNSASEHTHVYKQDTDSGVTYE